MNDQSRSPRDRPLTLPPEGTAWGIIAIILLSAGTPLMGAMALGQWSLRGNSLWIDNINWLIWLPIGLPLLPAFGWGARRFWAVAMWWFEAVLLAIAFPIVLVLASLVPLGLVVSPSPNKPFMHYYPLGFLLCLSPLLVPLIRLIRLDYFKPWSRPESWEVGMRSGPEN